MQACGPRICPRQRRARRQAALPQYRQSRPTASTSNDRQRCMPSSVRLRVRARSASGPSAAFVVVLPGIVLGAFLGILFGIGARSFVLAADARPRSGGWPSRSRRARPSPWARRGRRNAGRRTGSVLAAGLLGARGRLPALRRGAFRRPGPRFSSGLSFCIRAERRRRPSATLSRGIVLSPGGSPAPPGCRACEARFAGAAPCSAFERLRRRPRDEQGLGIYTVG